MWRNRGLFIAGLALGLGAAPQSADAKRIIYLNTQPTFVNSNNGQDPTTDSYSSTGFVPGMISGWPTLTPAQQQELTFFLKEAGVPFDMEFTFVRPAAGTYDMVVFGTDTDAPIMFPMNGCPTALGLADCADASAENISFLFYGCMTPGDQADMRRVAFNILTAAGFGWGLENVSVSGQIMGQFSFSALQFGDTCVDISGVPVCASHPGCAAGTINSTAELTPIIGARVDDGPPVVTITSPMAMESLPKDITVTADVNDLYGGLEVILTVVEVDQSLADDMPPYEWELTDIPPGVWTLRVTATDADANVTEEEVEICVDMACDGGTTTGGDDGGSTGDASTGDAGTGSTGDGGGGPITPPTTSAGQATFGGGGPETGCTCRSESPGPSAVWALGLWGLLAARRRRDVTRAG